MRHRIFLFIISILFIFACSSKEEEAQKPLAEQQFEFEIYDSLVVDYLGNLILMDISPDGNHFLLIDQNTDSIFVTDPKGEIKYRYKRTGEGPEMIQGNRIGTGGFLDNSSFILPSSRAIYIYSLQGELKKSYNPEFRGVSRLLIPSNPAHAVSNAKVFVQMPGRYSDLKEPGIEFQKKSRRLEVLDLKTEKFEPAIPFPAESKYSSQTEEHIVFDYYVSFTISGDSLYLAFRNEPKLFVYDVSNLEAPSKTKTLRFPQFIERDASTKADNEVINARDFFLGSISRIVPIDGNILLINYLSGLTDEEAKEIINEAKGDFDLMFKSAEKINEGGMVLFDGEEISSIISKPDVLGNLSLANSRDEIWFSPNFEEVENDYSVLYKTRLVSN